jgi:hypothetical protein
MVPPRLLLLTFCFLIFIFIYFALRLSEVMVPPRLLLLTFLFDDFFFVRAVASSFARFAASLVWVLGL